MPFDPRHNVIHTADGRLSPKAPTSAADVRRIVDEALAAGARSGIVVNFHGGLVSAKSALEAAELRLFPLYADRGKAYPIFFVWESGFFEAPWNNLREIAEEALFQEFMKKVGEWVARKLHGGLTAAMVAKHGDAPAQIRADLDAWFKSGHRKRKLSPRLREFRAIRRSPFAARLAAAPPDRNTLAKEIEANLARDRRFQMALAAAEAGLHPGRRSHRMARSGGARVSATSLIDKEGAAKLFPAATGRRKTRLASGWLHVAKVVAAIVLRVLRRVWAGRDHGKYVTLVEENGSRVRNLRIFAMDDERERDDVLVPVIYPASLLYFVSGLLEDEADQPLIGMQRYLANTATYAADAFPNVEKCREFFTGFGADKPLAWSPRTAPPGCATDGRHHQDFDDVDPATLDSVAHILLNGY